MKKNHFSKIINFRVVGILILIAFILLFNSKTAVSDTVYINLAQGWNFISLPILPTDNSTQAVLSNLSQNFEAYCYDASVLDPSNRWKIYDSDAPPVANTLTTMEPNKAYWLWVGSEQTLSVEGIVPAINKVTLYSGWNMVSFQSLSGSVVDVLYAMDITGKRINIYAYYPFELDISNRWKIYDSDAPPAANTLTTIEPTKGYWLSREIGQTIPPTIPVPEPSLMVLLGISVLSLAGLKRWWKE